MWSEEVIKMLIEGTYLTVYMTLVSALGGYLLGLPMGILLAVTSNKGIAPNKIVYKVFDFIINIARSIPFLILLILLIPFTRFIIGRSYGSTAMLVPLIIAAAPFIARLVESALAQVEKGVIEAAQSMGASVFTIIRKVLLVEARVPLIDGATITVGTILGYSAIAGAVGAGGLGDIAIRYGYYRYQTDIMLVTVILLIILVQIFQNIGFFISRSIDRKRL